MARYPFVQPDRRASSGSRGPVGYPAMTQHGHRGVSAPSFRDGAIPGRASRRKRFFFLRRRDTRTESRRKEYKRRIAGSLRLPAITPRGHRGVSAPSFRDGAIPRHHRGVKKTKGLSRGPFSYPAITPEGIFYLKSIFSRNFFCFFMRLNSFSCSLYSPLFGKYSSIISLEKSSPSLLPTHSR